MGLDGVEILVAVEDTFKITIADEVASTIRTPGDLANVIVKQVGSSQEKTCQTSRSFYRVRAAISSQCGLNRSTIHPSSVSEDVIPKAERRLHWGALQTRSGLAFPVLRRPKWAETTIQSLMLVQVALAVVLGVSKTIAAGYAWAIALLAIPVAIVLYKVTIPLARHIPSECRTIGLLASAVLAKNPKQFSDTRKWTEGDIWTAVQMIVVEQLGVPIEKVTRTAHFVDDLGLS